MQSACVIDNRHRIHHQMSINQRVPQDVCHANCSQGVTLNVDLWDRLSGSPIVRSTTPSEAPSLNSDFGDHMNDVNTDMLELNISTEVERMALDSVVHVHELPPSFAYAYFERESGLSFLNAPNGQKVANNNPVMPRVVTADVVLWMPVVSVTGDTGHRFLLVEEDVTQAHIDIFLGRDNQHSGDRIVIVHGLHSNFAHTAKLVDNNSIIEFNSIQSHVEKLHKTMLTINEDEMYLPVNEILIGSLLSLSNTTQLELNVPKQFASHPRAIFAAPVWRQTLQQLSYLSSLVTNCVQLHNNTEFARVCSLS